MLGYSRQWQAAGKRTLFGAKIGVAEFATIHISIGKLRAEATEQTGEEIIYLLVGDLDALQRSPVAVGTIRTTDRNSRLEWVAATCCRC